MDERRLEALLERGVAALENLAEDPEIMMETGPPVCPHCKKMNPNVRIHAVEGTGSLGEFVMQAHCLHCNNVFFGVPIQWDCLTDIREVREAIAERQRLTGFAVANATAQDS